jgi:hypothetical protein
MTGLTRTHDHTLDYPPGDTPQTAIEQTRDAAAVSVELHRLNWPQLERRTAGVDIAVIDKIGKLAENCTMRLPIRPNLPNRVQSDLRAVTGSKRSALRSGTQQATTLTMASKPAPAANTPRQLSSRIGLPRKRPIRSRPSDIHHDSP